MAWSVDELEMWVNRPVVDKSGNKLGTIVDVYMDDTTGNPEWLAIQINGLLSKRLRFVPLAGAAEAGNDVRVAYEKSLIKDSPSMELDGDLSADEEAHLYGHYGMEAPTADSDKNGNGIPDMQEAGSNSVNREMSPELARQRLLHRDEESIDFIDLEAEEAKTKSDSPK